MCVTRRTGSVETNDRVGKVGVETHSRRKGNGQVGKEAHAERSQGGNGSRSRDEVTLDDLHAQQIFLICGAQVGHAGFGTLAGATCIRQNGG